MSGFQSVLLPVLTGNGRLSAAPGDVPRASEPTACHREHGRLTFKLAAARGFCHGVERAVRLARETLAMYPDRRVFITSPILHNPDINADLRAAGVVFLSDAERHWDELTPRDVVLLPAFGVPPRVLDRLHAMGAIVIDTTCGSVVYVWKSVDRFARDGFTVVYHGRRDHEEAIATLGRVATVSKGRAAPWLVLETSDDALRLRDLILGVSGSRELPVALQGLASPGFDVERDLERIGLASQTTMLASETIEITRLLREAQALRFGDAALGECFRTQDTICGATQERQDALEELLRERLDLVLVVGGYSSSNSAHLAELASRKLPAFHIEGPAGILSRDAIEHKPRGQALPVMAHRWLPSGPTTIGLTSGASTPEGTLEAVIEKVCTVA